MATMNKPVRKTVVTKELSAYDKLRRSVMACLLWEDQFYEDGESISDRISEYMKEVTPAQAEKVLMEAKFDNKLRHAPLFIATKMAKRKMLSSDQVTKVITRVDDMAELIALYQNDKENRHMLPHSIQNGIAKAFPKFDEYQLAKYRGNKKNIKLKDVIRLTHPKPADDAQSKLWKKALEGTLSTPDTWEVAISATKDKKAEWERLLTEKTDKGFNKLGALALIRNLNGMERANVNSTLIRNAIKDASVGKLLPFQFVTAARHAPDMSDVLEKKFLECMENVEKLPGSTIILVDDSGSMGASLSDRGEISRADVASALGAIIREVADEPVIYAFTQELRSVPSSYRGFALADKLNQSSGGTSVIECTNEAIEKFRSSHDGKFPDRVIVVTDEQTNSDYSDWYGSRAKPLCNLPKKSHGYMVNVGSYEKGISYGDNSGWTTISGWSDSIVKYITAAEQ